MGRLLVVVFAILIYQFAITMPGTESRHASMTTAARRYSNVAADETLPLWEREAAMVDLSTLPRVHPDARFTYYALCDHHVHMRKVKTWSEMPQHIDEYKHLENVCNSRRVKLEEVPPWIWFWRHWWPFWWM